jgi:hypothetical protein
MTAGLHPKLPTIRRERGRQTGVALLTSKCASIGRPAAINVKSLKRHLITEGPTDANAYASLVCTYARWPITGELRKVPTVHILQREKSLAPRRLMLDASRERPIVRFAHDHVHVAGIVVGQRLAEASSGSTLP